ncbi:MAG: PEGA domain-containing protein [Gemmatimonadaceae bacterium]|nr:PEGA domain-containing protein [Chitinophagaceae bacterium]
MMKKLLFTHGFSMFLFVLMPFTALMAERVTVTTSPQNAKIYLNGVLMGSGKLLVTVPKKECVTVEIRLDGYVQETRTYCNKKGMTSPPRNEYIQLQVDESISATFQTDIANNEILINVKTTKSREEAWQQVVSTVLGKFDVLENNDEKAGYIRTSWNGTPFASNTVRVRLIVKQASEDPLTYKVKFVSEESGKRGTPFNADEQYRPFNRILKRYDGFIEELTTKLKN